MTQLSLLDTASHGRCWCGRPYRLIEQYPDHGEDGEVFDVKVVKCEKHAPVQITTWVNMPPTKRSQRCDTRTRATGTTPRS